MFKYMIKYMAVAVAVAVSGGGAVAVAVPVAGLTKRFFNQEYFIMIGGALGAPLHLFNTRL